MNSAIDRATVLKSGGMAALTLLLAQAERASADACCEPIDLRYISSGLQESSEVAQEYAAVRPRGRGIRLRSPRAGESSPPKLAGWTPLFFIPHAMAAGTDENGVRHGTNKGTPAALHYGIWVYTK